MAENQFSSIEAVRLNGFDGFVTWKDLWKKGCQVIPKTKGVYLILVPQTYRVEFLEKSVGGFFEDKDPTRSIDELKANWIDGASVVYIGMATNLRDRLRMYARFGQGRPVAHSGGKFIWQLKGCENLLVCWKSTGIFDQSATEAELISAFKKLNGGRRPFANHRG